MLYFSLFLAGFTLGVFIALKIFAAEREEERWDPQHFPAQNKEILLHTSDRQNIRLIRTSAIYPSPKADLSQ